MDKQTYWIWAAMKQRCANPNHKDYADYGGRGIGFDPRWARSAGFFADMGDKPAPYLTLERVDNEKGYSKANCIWAPRTVQARNRITSKLTAADATTIRMRYAAGEGSQNSLAREFGVSRSIVVRIIKWKAWR